MNEQLYKRTAEIDRRVGASVRAARIEAGLSQSRLASELGITFQQLQKYEKGRNRVAVGTLLLIADALSVSVHAFFDAIGIAPADRVDAPGSRPSESAQLMVAFDRIGDAEVRRRILTLVLAVSEDAGKVVALSDAAATEQAAAL